MTSAVANTRLLQAFVPLEDEKIEIPHVEAVEDEKESKLAATLRYSAMAASSGDKSPTDPTLKKGLKALMNQATKHVNKAGTGDRTDKSIWFKNDKELEEERRMKEIELHPVRLWGWQGEAKLYGHKIKSDMKDHAAAIVKKREDGSGDYFVRLRDPATRDWLEADLDEQLLESYATKFGTYAGMGVKFSQMDDDLREDVFKMVCSRLQIVSWREFARVNKKGNLLVAMPADVHIGDEEVALKDLEAEEKKCLLKEKVHKYKIKKKRKQEMQGVSGLEGLLLTTVNDEEGSGSDILSETSSEHNIFGDDGEELQEEYVTDDESYDDDVFNCDICNKRIEPKPGMLRFFAEILDDYDLCGDCFKSFPSNASDETKAMLHRDKSSVWSRHKIAHVPGAPRELTAGHIRPPPMKENVALVNDYLAQLARELETGEAAVPKEGTWAAYRDPNYVSEDEAEEEGGSDGLEALLMAAADDDGMSLSQKMDIIKMDTQKGFGEGYDVDDELSVSSAESDQYLKPGIQDAAKKVVNALSAMDKLALIKGETAVERESSSEEEESSDEEGEEEEDEEEEDEETPEQRKTRRKAAQRK